MANNELRTILQKEAVDILLAEKRLIVEWGTGVGKSRVAINSVKSIVGMKKNRILLLVTESAHKLNWRTEFKDALGSEGEEIFNRITVECYASLPKYKDSKWDLIVADEAHHLRSDNRVELLGTISCEYFLCLSATLSNNNDAENLINTLNDSFGDFRRVRISLQEAIDREILKEPSVKIHLVEFDIFPGEYTANVYWGFKSARRKICVKAEDYPDIIKKRNENIIRAADVYVTGNAKVCNRVYDEMIDYCKKICADLEKDAYNNPYASYESRENAKRQLLYARNALKRVGDDRQNFIGSLKTEIARRIISELGDKKYICFCSSLEQGQEIAPEYLISSKRTKKENARIIADFNEYRSNAILAVNMLVEGANLAGIDAAIVIQLGSKSRTFVQQLGRAMRSDNPEIHVVLINHSADVKFFKSAVEDTLNPQYIEWCTNEYDSNEPSIAVPKI